MPGPLLPLLTPDEARAASKDAGLPEVLGDTSLFQLCLRHPPVAKLVGGVVQTLVFRSRLDPRLRELAILRVGWRMGSVYEWTNHYHVARRLGASDDDVRGVRDWRTFARFGEAERLVLGAVDEALDRDVIGETTVARARALFGDEALLELVLLPGLYRSVAVLLASLRVPLEAHLTPWPPDGTAPRA